MKLLSGGLFPPLPPDTRQRLLTAYHLLVRVSWAAFFFTLPFTSFPFFPSGLGGKTLVRPLATYPMIVLGLLVILPRLLKRPLPRTFLPLLAFVIVATTSSLVSLSADIEALRGITLLSRLVRSLATLGLGVAFYFTVALLPETREDLRFSLRWLYAGFALALAWGSLQALYVIHYSPAYFKLLNQLQSFVSSRKLFATRISGFTYEPKWFAEQICLLLIPWLLGAVLSRQSIFNCGKEHRLGNIKRWLNKQVPFLQRLPIPKWLTLEWLLLAWASVVLLFTFSRTGLVVLGTLIVLSFLIFRSSPKNPLPSGGQSQVSQPPNRRVTRTSKKRILLEIIAVICGLIAVFVLVGSQNPYFSRFWRYFTEAKQRNRTYLEYIAFDQRFTYWLTAYNMFESQPLMGVGLGNYAFYFEEMLPDKLYRQAEVIRQTTPVEGGDRLITPKNLPARLLAETGTLGSATFLTFLVSITGCVLFLWFKGNSMRFSSGQMAISDPRPDHPADWYSPQWGIGGALALVSSAFVMFSMDSFARPEIWVVFGLITAAAHLPEAVSTSSAPAASAYKQTPGEAAQNG